MYKWYNGIMVCTLLWAFETLPMQWGKTHTFSKLCQIFHSKFDDKNTSVTWNLEASTSFSTSNIFITAHWLKLSRYLNLLDYISYSTRILWAWPECSKTRQISECWRHAELILSLPTLWWVGPIYFSKFTRVLGFSLPFYRGGYGNFESLLKFPLLWVIVATLYSHQYHKLWSPQWNWTESNWLANHLSINWANCLVPSTSCEAQLLSIAGVSCILILFCISSLTVIILLNKQRSSTTQSPNSSSKRY